MNKLWDVSDLFSSCWDTEYIFSAPNIANIPSLASELQKHAFKCKWGRRHRCRAQDHYVINPLRLSFFSHLKAYHYNLSKLESLIGKAPQNREHRLWISLCMLTKCELTWHWYSNIHFSPVQAAITPFTQQNLFTESGCGPVELWEAVFWSAKSSITTRSYKHHYAPATTLNIRTYFASALNLYSKRNLHFSCCYSSRFRETA